MTTSQDLLGMVIAAIVGPDGAPATDAGARVFKPGDWPSQPDQYPLVRVRLVSEDRQSTGRGGASSFTTTTTVRVTGEVSAPERLDTIGSGATAAEVALWQLKRQIEVAVVSSYPLSRVTSQIASMRSQLSFAGDGGTHLAGIQIDVALEFFEDEEDFAPLVSMPLAAIGVTATNYPPVGLSVAVQP